MKYLQILCFLLFSLCINAQVGINTTSPFVAADLDIKNMVVGGDTIPRGMLIPKLTTSQRNEINVSSKSANSLFIYNIDEDCYNYYSTSYNDWMSLCGKLGKAEIGPVTCDNIEVVGNYIEGVNMTSSNYLNVTLDIIKPGVFTISGLTANGYYFNSQISAPSKGTYTFRVTAYGKPTAAQADDVILYGEGFLTSKLECPAKVNVLEPIGEYTMNCSSVKLNGTYLKGVALTPSEYIEVSVNVGKTGSYAFTTVQKNGIIFTATGVFATTGSQTVKLMGKGASTSNSDFTVDITSNSQVGQTQCSTTISPLLASMTYAIIGNSTDANSWNNSPRKEVLANASNFSKTGVVKINNFKQLWATDSPADAISYLNSGYTNGAYPDIVFFYSPGITQSASLANALASYVDKGGYVIYGTTDGDVTNTNLLLSAIFGADTKSQTQIAGTVTSNDVYNVSNDPSDPIVNGPFYPLYNLAYWGENGTSTSTVIVPTLPANAVQLVSASNTNGKASVDPIYSIVWYSPKSNFVYFGSSVGASITNDGLTKNPAYYLNYTFGSKSYGNGTSQYVSNSTLELNAINWCLQQSSVNGINAN